MTVSNVQSRIAGLAGDNHTINGVAIGPDDVTRGLSGDRKVWQSPDLREAASTLEGTEVNPLHSQASVGEVTRAGFDPERGVVYEVELEDENLAEQVAKGGLEVSIEARHSDGGVVETPQGEAMRATDIEFTGLALVQHGAAPSASAQPGEAAALSAEDISAALSDEEGSAEDESAAMTDDSVSPERGQDEGMDSDNETTTSDSTTMSEDNNDPESPDVDALLQRVDEKDERIEELEAELSDVREELSETEDEVEQAARAYAEALADETVFSEDELVEKFEVEELREKVESTEGASLADAEPDVQSGGSESEETASRLRR